MRGRITCLEGSVETVALPAGHRGEPGHAGNGGGRRPAGGAPGMARGRPSQRLGKGPGAGVPAPPPASPHPDSDEDLPVFFGRLSETVAGLVRARRAGFWRLGPQGVLSLQPTAFGFAADSPIHALRIDRGPGGEGAADRTVLGDDLEVVGGTSPELDSMWRELGLTGIKSSIAVPWRAGDRLIGDAVAFDSRRGFTSTCLCVLRLAAMATGLVWQYKEAEDDLGTAAVRLEDALAARRRLMNNIASGGDEARRRF